MLRDGLVGNHRFDLGDREPVDEPLFSSGTQHAHVLREMTISSPCTSAS